MNKYQAQLDAICRKAPMPAPLNNGISKWQAARAADDAIEQADINATLARYEKTL